MRVPARGNGDDLVEFYVQRLDWELGQVWVDFINADGDIEESRFVGGVMNIPAAERLVKKMNERVRLDSAAGVG